LKSWWRKIQQFSIDSNINLDAVLDLPFNFIDEYYASEAWKVKKEEDKKNAQMNAELIRLLTNYR
jgi:hypothetical protein